MGRQELVKEIIDTERAYVENLQLIDELYVRPLKEPQPTMPGAAPSLLIDPKDWKRLFSDIPVIINVNSELLRQLEESYDHQIQGIKCKSIGEIFLDLGPWLKVYTQYCNNYDEFVSSMRVLLKKNPKFDAFVKEKKLDARSRGLSWDSFFIMPVQRIPRYCLLLKEIVAQTSSLHNDYHNLCDALELLKKVAAYVNARMNEFNAKKTMIQLKDRIEGLDFELVAPARVFVFEVELSKVTSRLKSKPKTFLVFNDIILYCKPLKSGMLRFRGSISFNVKPQIWIRPLDDTEMLQNAFQIVTPSRVYLLAANSPDIKRDVTAKLDSVIAAYIAKNPQLGAEGKAAVTYKTKFFKFLSVSPFVYDTTVPPPLPTLKSLPFTQSEAEELKSKYLSLKREECVCLCKCLHPYADSQAAQHTSPIKPLPFTAGDLLLVFTKSVPSNSDWWIVRHSGFRLEAPGQSPSNVSPTPEIQLSLPQLSLPPSVDKKESNSPSKSPRNDIPNRPPHLEEQGRVRDSASLSLSSSLSANNRSSIMINRKKSKSHRMMKFVRSENETIVLPPTIPSKASGPSSNSPSSSPSLQISDQQKQAVLIRTNAPTSDLGLVPADFLFEFPTTDAIQVFEQMADLEKPAAGAVNVALSPSSSVPMFSHSLPETPTEEPDITQILANFRLRAAERRRAREEQQSN